MKKYMVIIVGDGEQSAHFCDDFVTADNIRMDAEVSMGYYAEVYCYIRTDENDPHEPEGYVCIG